MKKVISKLIIALVAMLGILYVVFQIYYVVSPNYRTEVAVLYEVTDEIYASGTVVRDEQVAETDPGVKYYIVQDGDKVAAGSVVAERYADPAIAVKSIYINLLRREAAVLTSIQKGNRGTANLTSLNRSIYRSLSEYTASRLSGDLSSVGAKKVELLSLLGAYNMSSGNEIDVDARLKEVNSEIFELSKQTLTPSSEITTANSGYFISFTDGCENIISVEDFEELSVKQLVEKVQLSHERYSYNDSTYKILSDFSWYYLTYMDQESAQRLRTGRTYTLNFAHSNSGDLPGRVYSILQDDTSDKVVVIFQFDRLNPNIALLRNEDVTIKFYDYSGVLVRKSSLRLVDGEVGVFIKYGDTVKFRKLDIIYETDNYVVSSLQENSDTYVTLYDEIIVSGKDLYLDKKLS